MANTFTTAYADLVSKLLESVLRQNAIMSRLVSTDYSADLAVEGQSVTANFPGDFTTQDKALATDVTIQAATLSGVQIVLNKHKEVSFKIDDIEKTKASPKSLVDGFLSSAFKAIVNTVDVDLLALNADVISAGYTVGTGGTDLVLGVINNADRSLNTRNVPVGDRHLVLSSLSKEALQDPSVAQNSIQIKTNEAGNSDILEMSRMPDAYGFARYLDQNVRTSTVSGVTSQLNLGFNRRAFALVVRRLELPTEGVLMATYVTDPISGLEIRVIISWDHKALAHICTCDIVYGVKTLDAKKAVVVYG